MHEAEKLYRLFQETFYKHYEPLCKYAYTIVKEPHSCEDIVQETFLRVWEKKQNLIGSEELTWYLYTAIRNNCLSFQEKKQKTVLGDFNGQEIIDTPGEERPSPSATPEADYDTLLKNALENLPPKCREVFVLSRVSNLTYKQISDSLGISIKTVENQMGKALKILRSYIRKKQGLTIFLCTIFMFLTS
ncbi:MULTISPECIES: RNA polymerase sigma-70 factor [Niastella]|uniref:RNA polymerase sigma-70 factor n=1 Tax=Niastella soli TaxID=2821487 RepID=A0ABS3YYX6_9BACT|nr:RNA polymerase sigma-70 factor [Niastella soli]MBO9203123.1 RNA polymerase sigma-70 factor [Niastella soli]